MPAVQEVQRAGPLALVLRENDIQFPSAVYPPGLIGRHATYMYIKMHSESPQERREDREKRVISQR